MDKFVLNVPKWQGELFFSKDILVFVGIILLMVVGILFCFWGYKFFRTILFMGIGIAACYGSYLLVEPMTANSVIRMFLTVSLTFMGVCFVYFLDIILGFVLDKLRIRAALGKRIYLLAAPLGAAILGLTIYYMIWRDEIAAVAIAVVCLVIGLVFQHSRRKKQVRFRSYDDLIKLPRPEFSKDGLEFISLGTEDADAAVVAAVPISGAEKEVWEPVETAVYEPEAEPEPVETAVYEPEAEPEPVEAAVYEPEAEPEPVEAAVYEPEAEPESVKPAAFEPEAKFVGLAAFETRPEIFDFDKMESVMPEDFKTESAPAGAVMLEFRQEAAETVKTTGFKPSKISIQMEAASEIEVDILEDALFLKQIKNNRKEKAGTASETGRRKGRFSYLDKFADRDRYKRNTDKAQEWKLTGGVALMAFGLGFLLANVVPSRHKYRRLRERNGY